MARKFCGSAWEKTLQVYNFLHTGFRLFAGTGMCLFGDCTTFETIVEQWVVSKTLQNFSVFMLVIDSATASPSMLIVGGAQDVLGITIQDLQKTLTEFFSGNVPKMVALGVVQDIMWPLCTIPNFVGVMVVLEAFYELSRIIVVLIPLLNCLPTKCEGLECLQKIVGVDLMRCRRDISEPRITALGITASFVPCLPVILVNFVFLFVVECAQWQATKISTWTNTDIEKIQVLLDLFERWIVKIVANQCIVTVARCFSEDIGVNVYTHALLWLLYVTLKTKRLGALTNGTNVLLSRIAVVCRWLLCFIPHSFSWIPSTPLMQAPNEWKKQFTGFTLEADEQMKVSLRCARVLPGLCPRPDKYQTFCMVMFCMSVLSFLNSISLWYRKLSEKTIPPTITPTIPPTATLQHSCWGFMQKCTAVLLKYVRENQQFYFIVYQCIVLTDHYLFHSPK